VEEITDLNLLEDLQAQRAAEPSGAGPVAGERFYQRYDPLIRRLARRMGRRWGIDPEDGAQEIWLAVLESLRQFHYRPDRGRFRAWLSTVAWPP
jgi:DNA-directed RNA polymerase specialized sigma24 family protein